jgi:hypothetical protein
LLGGKHIVVREADDTDADYQSGQALLDAALDVARRG